MLDPPLFLTLPLSPPLFVDRLLEDGWWLFLIASIRCGYMKTTYMRALQWLQSWLGCFSFFFFLGVWSGASWANRWKEKLLGFERAQQVRDRSTSRAFREQKKSWGVTKIKLGGNHFVSLDGWGQWTAETWAHKPAGQNYTSLDAKMGQGKGGQSP